jgi:hypothetical protein
MPRQRNKRGSATRTRPSTRTRRAVKTAIRLMMSDGSCFGRRSMRLLEPVITKVAPAEDDFEDNEYDDDWYDDLFGGGYLDDKFSKLDQQLAEIPA